MKLRIIGFILIGVFIPYAVSILAIRGFLEMPIWFIVFSILTISIGIPFGFSLIVFQSKNSKFYKYLYLIIALVLIISGFASKYLHWPGASIEVIFGILWFSFAYSPLELRDKYLRWLPYTTTKLESFLLSALDFIGASSFAIGLMFKVQHYPLADLIIYSGIVLLILGMISWNYKFKKEIVRRKQAEDKIQDQYNEIQDSINYAERLQRCLMANKKILDENLNDYFIYFNPKEAVSGDFYWASKLNNNQFVLVCADSTGHGVPGAIMSMMNMNSLNEVIKEGYTESNEILNNTRNTIIKTLANDGSPEGGKDGMDAALLIFNHDKTKLEFSLANNPLWLVRTSINSDFKDVGPDTNPISFELIEYKPDKMPVGKHERQNLPFTKHEIELHKGDMIYIFTDGFADQFGGENGKKFKYSALKSLVLSIAKKSAQEQSLVLSKTFENWRGNLEQIDDVCVIGVRL